MARTSDGAPATASSGAACPACPPTSCPPSPYDTAFFVPAVPSANPYANDYMVNTPSYSANVSGYAAPAGAVPAPYPVVGATWQRPAAPTLPSLKLADVVRLIEAGVDEEVITLHDGALSTVAEHPVKRNRTNGMAVMVVFFMVFSIDEVDGETK